MTLHVHTWGPEGGEPVVCLHGVTGHGGRFAHLAARLEGRRVLGIDLLGHAASPAEPPWDLAAHLGALTATADAHGAGRAAWVGHSFGGRLVAELAAAFPERIERAVLLDPALHIEPAIAGERAELACADVSFASPDEAIDARLADGSLFTTPRTLLEEEAAAHLRHDADGRWRWHWSRPAVIGAWSIMSRPGAGVPASIPTLLVLGARSWIVPPAVPAGAPVEVVTVPGGHSVLWDDLAATADAVAAFLTA